MKQEFIKNFFEGLRSDSLPFVINDCVEITSDKNKGKAGSIISIVQTEPKLEYLVEFGDGSGDLVIEAIWLKLYKK